MMDKDFRMAAATLLEILRFHGADEAEVARQLGELIAAKVDMGVRSERASAAARIRSFGGPKVHPEEAEAIEQMARAIEGENPLWQRWGAPGVEVWNDKEYWVLDEYGDVYRCIAIVYDSESVDFTVCIPEGTAGAVEPVWIMPAHLYRLAGPPGREAGK